MNVKCFSRSLTASSSSSRSRPRPSPAARIEQLVYPVTPKIEQLLGTASITLVGTDRPVAFFAYPDKPGILTQEGTEFVELCDWGGDILGGLDALCDAVGANAALASGNSGTVKRIRP